jgi:hypothetical protein
LVQKSGEGQHKGNQQMEEGMRRLKKVGQKVIDGLKKAGTGMTYPGNKWNGMKHYGQVFRGILSVTVKGES